MQTERSSLATELQTQEESAAKSFSDYTAWRIAQRQFQKRLVQIGVLTKNKQAVDGEVDVVETMMKQLKVSEDRVREQFNAGNVYYEAQMNKELKPVVFALWCHVAAGGDLVAVTEVQGVGTETEGVPAVELLRRV